MGRKQVRIEIIDNYRSDPGWVKTTNTLKSSADQVTAKIARLEERLAELEMDQRTKDRALSKLEDMDSQNSSEVIHSCQQELDAARQELDALKARLVASNNIIKDCLSEAIPLLARLRHLRHSDLFDLSDHAFYTNFVDWYDSTLAQVTTAASLINVPVDLSSSVPCENECDVTKLITQVDPILSQLKSPDVNCITMFLGATGGGKTSAQRAALFPHSLVRSIPSLDAALAALPPDILSEEDCKRLNLTLKRQGWVFVPLSNPDQYPIGILNNGCSTTLLPEVHVDANTGTAYLDTPGWIDNHGPDRQLAIDSIFRSILCTGKVVSVKVVVEWDKLTARDGSALQALYHNVKATGLSHAAHLVVTSVPILYAHQEDDLHDTYDSYTAALREWLGDVIPSSANINPAFLEAFDFFRALVPSAEFVTFSPALPIREYDPASYPDTVKSFLFTPGPHAAATPLAPEDVPYVLSSTSINHLKDRLVTAMAPHTSLPHTLKAACSDVSDCDTRLPDATARVAGNENRLDNIKTTFASLPAQLEAARQAVTQTTSKIKSTRRAIKIEEDAHREILSNLKDHQKTGDDKRIIQVAEFRKRSEVNFTFQGPHVEHKIWQRKPKTSRWVDPSQKTLNKIHNRVHISKE